MPLQAFVDPTAFCAFGILQLHQMRISNLRLGLSDLDTPGLFRPCENGLNFEVLTNPFSSLAVKRSIGAASPLSILSVRLNGIARGIGNWHP